MLLLTIPPLHARIEGMANLHKVLKVGVVVVGFIGLMVATILGAIWISHADSRRAAAKEPKCSGGNHKTYKVVFQNDKVVPSHIDAARCDKLTITNLDDKQRFVAFGEHDRHTAYDGVEERYLTKKGSFTITLIQDGTFLFHDHLDDEAAGTFTVR